MDDGNAEIGKSLVASGRIVDLPLPQEMSVPIRDPCESREYPFHTSAAGLCTDNAFAFRHATVRPAQTLKQLLFMFTRAFRSLSLLLLAFATLASTASAGEVFYVSTDGNDRWS